MADFDDGLSPEELEEQAVVELPVRESLSIISGNLVGPIHPALTGAIPTVPAPADADPAAADMPAAPASS
jgi:hypothetical protein